MCIFPVALLLVIAGTGLAESDTNEPDREKRPSRFIPFPVVFYSPETGFGFGAGALYYVDPHPDAVVQKPDTINGIGFYTVKNQMLLAMSMNRYLRRNGNNLSVKAVGMKFPDKFWGIGPDTPDIAEEDYTPREIAFTIAYQWRLSPYIYLGPAYGFSDIAMKEVEEGGLLDEGSITGSDGTRLSALGARFTLDKRDSTFYTRRGYLVDATFLAAGHMLGSSEDFIQMDLDYRHFFSVFNDHVVALQYILQLRTGTVPFQFLPRLGGQYMMRGFYEGRYRDMDYSALQAEYRFPLFWRLGGVVFGSIGKVGPDIPTLFSFSDLRATAGAGLRILMDAENHVNFRVDVAYNGREIAFYFNVLEAF